ncbi:hypothetical protein LINPERPRIM_LOCUS14468 [Linum perenne]
MVGEELRRLEMLPRVPKHSQGQRLFRPLRQSMRVLQSDMTTQLRGELATYLVASKMARASEAMGEALRKHPDRFRVGHSGANALKVLGLRS